MVVVTYNGQTYNYYIQHRQYVYLYIDSISEKNADGDIVWLRYDYDWAYDNETETGFDVLTIYSENETLPNDLTITTNKENANVKLKDSDKDGYDKLLELEYKECTRKYYVKHEQYITFEFDVSAKENDTEIINGSWTDTVYDESSNRIRVLNIQSENVTLPEDVEITETKKNATVSIEKSDIDNYEKMVVVTYNGQTYNYYIKHKQNINLSLTNVEAYDENNNSMIEGWNVEWNGDEINPINELIIKYNSESIPNDITFTANKSDAQIDVTTSDELGYDNMIVISYKGYTVKYYVIYQLNEDYYLNVAVENLDSTINNKNNLYSIVIYNNQELDLNDISIKAINDKAQVSKIETTEEDGYQGKVTVSYNDISRTYYIKLVTIINLSDDLKAVNKVTDIYEGENYTIQFEGYNNDIYNVYSFTPTEDGYYLFTTDYTDSYMDTYGVLYDESFVQIESNDDGGEDSNFAIKYECKANKTYYIAVRPYDSNDKGTTELKVIKEADIDTTTDSNDVQTQSDDNIVEDIKENEVENTNESLQQEEVKSSNIENDLDEREEVQSSSIENDLDEQEETQSSNIENNSDEQEDKTSKQNEEESSEVTEENDNQEVEVSSEAQE
jgi:hypothetical protein